jgi:hypothetical protein
MKYTALSTMGDPLLKTYTIHKTQSSDFHPFSVPRVYGLALL